MTTDRRSGRQYRVMATWLAPFRWIGRHRLAAMVIAVLWLGELWHAAISVNDSSARNPPLDWLVVGLGVYAALNVLVLAPFVIVPRSKRQVAAETWIAMNLAYSVSPFLIAFAVFLSGADSWVMPVAFAESLVLLAFSLVRSAPAPAV